MTPEERLPHEAALLALKLAMNNTLALHQAGLLPSDLAGYCAGEMKRVAKLFDDAVGLEALPPRLSEHLHTLAVRIDPQGRAPYPKTGG
jgi:hypothetical protein